MADIISDRNIGDEEIVSLIELLFFAYRDFTSDPDAILAEWGFGRAHHRVVHFVGRNPGMTVAQLLSILGITKQSLGRVLRDLVERDLVYQRAGDLDRRQRLLFLTKEGESLRIRLMAPQAKRIIRALSEAGEETEPSYRKVLYHLISPENRNGVSDWLRSRKSKAGE
jgi:DNA-binding MarR family transcriptional regulator